MLALRLPRLRLAPPRLARFARDDRGNMTVEAAILMPILLMTFVGLYSVFDGFRQQSVDQRAAYTLSDMLSRETDLIDDTYIDNAYKMLRFLANTQDSNVRMRISVVSYNEFQDRYTIEWSEVRGGTYKSYLTKDVKDWHDILPIMADGDQLILVETQVDYIPPVGFGLGKRTISTRVFNRPRFTSQLRWDDGTGAGA